MDLSRLEPARFGGSQGWREFLAEKHDLIRAFQSAQEKSSSRRIKTEHGNVAEGVFREWLAGFLPGRYGVTSGYIISPGRSADAPTSHFDVIIYDKLESPVLWRENNPDRSSAGLSRPIPVEHVLAVIEVKSTLTKRSAGLAMEKLADLEPYLSGADEPDEPYPIYLRKGFASAVVFFQVAENCPLSALDPLIRPDLRGFCGGLVLSVKEKPLIASAGWLSLHKNTDVSQALHKKLLDDYLAFSTPREIDGIRCAVSSLWHPNCFVRFTFDLLRRISGRHRGPGEASTTYAHSY